MALSGLTETDSTTNGITWSDTFAIITLQKAVADHISPQTTVNLWFLSLFPSVNRKQSIEATQSNRSHEMKRGWETFVAPLVSGLFDNNFIFNPTISKTRAIGTCPQPVFFGHLTIFLLNDLKIKSISSYRLFHPVTQISKNEKITNAFKRFRRYVRNFSVKKNGIPQRLWIRHGRTR